MLERLGNILVNIKENKNFRNGVLFSLFSFFNSGINFLIATVLAWYISPDSYGMLSLFTTVVSLFTIFICLNTNGYIGVNFFRLSKLKICSLINVVLITSIVVFAVLLLLTIAFRATLQVTFGLPYIYYVFAISYCFFYVFYSLLMDIWRLEGKVWKYGILSSLLVVLNLFLTLLFVKRLSLDWPGRVYAQLIACIIFFVVSTVILIKKGYIKRILPTKKEAVECYKFALPLVPHSTSFWLRQGCDRYIINLFLSQSMVGFFSFASNFGNIIQIIGFAFNSSNSVDIYQTLSSKDNDKFRRLNNQCRLLIVFYILLTIVVILLSSLLIPWAFPKYRDSVVYLFPLCVGSMFQCFYLVYVNIIIFYKKTTRLMYITLSFSLLHTILSVLLTRYGVIYTAYISVLSNMLIFVGVYRYSKRIINENINIKLA